ncbi:MAG: hypothetical protein AB1758_15335, partial [Candidatus Eremiobacterota bacterium]
GLWFGKGALRRLVAPASPAPAARPRPVGALVATLAVAALLGAGATMWTSQQQELVQQRAREAWVLRADGALEGAAERLPPGTHDRGLARARVGYLRQDFVACLQALDELEDPSAREVKGLRRRAEEAWMGQLDWPALLAGRLALDTKDGRVLIRVVNPGYADEGLRVDVLRKADRKLAVAEATWLEPQGTPLKKPEKAVKLLDLRSGKLVGDPDALLEFLLSDGRFALDVLSLRKEGLHRYRFVADQRLKVKDGTVEAGERRWRWEDDQFVSE